LIWLRNELCTWLEQERVCGLSCIEDAPHIVTIFEVDRCELGWCIVCCLWWERGGLDYWSAGEVVVEDGLAVGFGLGIYPFQLVIR
jgi:hypothetical protein